MNSNDHCLLYLKHQKTYCIVASVFFFWSISILKSFLHRTILLRYFEIMQDWPICLHERVLIFFVVFNLLPHSWWDLISTKQNSCHCPTHKYCKWVHLNQNICHYQHVRLWCLWHSTLISCCLSTYNGYSFRSIFFLSKIQNFTECNLIVLSFQDNWFLIKSSKDIQQLDLFQNITRNRHYISKSLLKLLCK